MEWVNYSGSYISGVKGMLGKWEIFRVFYDGSVSCNDDNKYQLACALPGIKDRLGHFASEDLAKERAEQVLAYWLKESKLS